MHRGTCLCGGIRFEISGPLAPIQVCHCSQCRKAQGGPFATNIPVELACLHFAEGRALLREFESSAGKFRAFCERCGSPIFSRRSALPDVVRIRAGALVEPIATRPAAQFHVGERVAWWPLNETLPKFDGSAPQRKNPADR